MTVFIKLLAEKVSVIYFLVFWTLVYLAVPTYCENPADFVVGFFSVHGALEPS